MDAVLCIHQDEALHISWGFMTKLKCLGALGWKMGRTGFESCVVSLPAGCWGRGARAGDSKVLVLLPQDVADFEWVMWFTSFRNVIIFALSGHVLFGKICSMTVPQVSQGCGGMDLKAPG